MPPPTRPATRTILLLIAPPAIAYTALFIAWSQGWLRRLTAECYFGMLQILGPSRPQRLGPLRYSLGEHRYLVIDRCTPVFICLASFALLALARLSPIRYLLACAAVYAGSMAATTLNNTVSMWIRPQVGWHMAHRPGLTAIYIIIYLLCLLLILRAHRVFPFRAHRSTHVPFLPCARDPAIR